MSATRPAARLLFAGIVATLSCGIAAPAAEICRFTGTTDYSGHVAVTTRVTARAGAIQVDVAGTFDSSTMFWFGVHYLFEEVSRWHDGQLESVAVNSRYLIGDHIVRQQWDDFQRRTDGLQAYRVQAKTLADFRRGHPGFIQHWDPATFGQPWLDDYPAALPERRVDLDLKGAPLPSGLRTPLAMAFYWVRWLRGDSQAVSVFLPGFKRDLLVDLRVTSSPAASGTLWRAPQHYPALEGSPASNATALVSPDRHLSQLAFELHTFRGSGRGIVTQQGCEGTPVVPVGWRSAR
jgi:hypothetical protein